MISLLQLNHSANATGTSTLNCCLLLQKTQKASHLKQHLGDSRSGAACSMLDKALKLQSHNSKFHFVTSVQNMCKRPRCT